MTALASIDDYIDAKLVHEIHTSERRSFKACRRRWDWLFRDGYYPITTAKPLEFGVAYHRAMEVYYDPATWTWDREVVAANAILAFVQKCEKQKAEAIQATGHLYLEGEQEEDYAERVELGKGMLKYYFENVAPKEDKGWRPVFVEVGFMVPIHDPEERSTWIWCTCTNCFKKWNDYLSDEDIDITPAKWMSMWRGLPVVYAGRIDMLAVDKQGNYYIFDWKTARNVADRYEFLYLDDQIGSYVWALKRILELNIKGFVYHEQRKGYPQAPKMNKQRRLGCLFSVAKNQDVDYDTYLETVKTHDREAYELGHYDEMLEYLRNEGIVYFARHQIIKTEVELDEIEKNIGYEALDMVDPGLRIYPSAGRFGCSFCAFQQPCMEKNGGGDYQYALNEFFEVREPYYIRNDPSTESKGGE